ncbi:hypothetical protein LINPERHAP2_LOCUS30559 [Linum perenne]
MLDSMRVWDNHQPSSESQTPCNNTYCWEQPRQQSANSVGVGLGGYRLLGHRPWIVNSASSSCLQTLLKQRPGPHWSASRYKSNPAAIFEIEIEISTNVTRRITIFFIIIRSSYLSL